MPIDDARAVNALFGLDSSDTAGLNVNRKGVGALKAETLMNYELGFRVNTRKLYARVDGFDAELIDPISGRTLLFPTGQVPPAIGGVRVLPLAQSAAQQAAGVVAVATDLSPRAVHTAINEGRSRYMGIEALARYQFTSRWRVEMNYSFLSGRDLNPVHPIRRLPPQEGALRIWYTPSGRRPWFLINSRFAGPQTRLNGGDIDDDRIGASRRRSDVASFFRAGVVSRYIQPGSDGMLGNADDVFGPTGETLLQIQNRVLPLGATINGVLVSGDGIEFRCISGTPDGGPSICRAAIRLRSSSP